MFSDINMLVQVARQKLADRQLPDNFEHRLSTYCHKLTQTERSLPIRRPQLRKIHDNDISLFHDTVLKDPSIENLQLYGICVLAWASALRPSSYLHTTLGRGRLPATTLDVLKRCDSLRWEHAKFFTRPEGIGVELTFELFNDNAGMYFANTEESRVFTFLPVLGRRLHLDLAGLLFSLAYQ
jgi:hypothetical protein